MSLDLALIVLLREVGIVGVGIGPFFIEPGALPTDVVSVARSTPKRGTHLKVQGFATETAFGHVLIPALYFVERFERARL